MMGYIEKIVMMLKRINEEELRKVYYILLEFLQG